MTEDQIKLIQEYVTELVNEEKAEILAIVTAPNPRKGAKEPKFITVLEVKDKKMGLVQKEVFNSLKILRSILKEQKYGQFQ